MMTFDATQAMTSQANLAMSQSQGLDAQNTLAAGKSSDPASIRKASESFEAMFVSQMFSHMFESVGNDSVFGGGQGEAMFRPMLIDEYSKSVVKKGGLGLADSIMRTLISQQEKAS